MKKKNVLVLLIDDDPAVRSAFQLALEDTCCNVTVAACGERGLATLDGKKIDLVFLDLKMPGMDGVTCLRRIKEKFSNTPVYIVTAFAEEFVAPLRQAALDGLEFELVRKPLDRTQIREVTASLLGDIEGELLDAKGGQ